MYRESRSQYQFFFYKKNSPLTWRNCTCKWIHIKTHKLVKWLNLNWHKSDKTRKICFCFYHWIIQQKLDFNIFQMLQDGLVVILNHIRQHVYIFENCEPKFRYSLCIFIWNKKKKKKHYIKISMNYYDTQVSQLLFGSTVKRAAG